MNTDALLTYGAPFLGAVLLSLGIAGGVLGGYSAIQADAGLCGDPLVSVATQEETARLQSGHGPGGGPALERIAFSELSDAEQAAFEEAITKQNREGAVTGEFTHRALVEQGVLVEHEGESYYVTLASENRCLAADPLLLPLGVAGILLGVVGVLMPPLYRRYVAFERRQRRGP